MLSAVITVSLFVVMLLILSYFVVGAWQEYRRYKQRAGILAKLPPHPLDRHVTAVLHVQNGQIVSVEETGPLPAFTLPPSWYKRRRMLVSLGFIAMIALTLLTQGGLAGGTLLTLSKGLNFSFLAHLHTTKVQATVHMNASALLKRVDSADPKQYSAAYQLQSWSFSSCSGIAMEMVMNAYGRHFIASDVLQKELELGVWNVQLGLLREDGIAMTAAAFGFNTDAGHKRSLQDVVDTANSGRPVIVSVRDSYNFPGGHLFVIRGGDGQNVFVADSSPANFQHMSYPMFQRMWQGFSAVLTPR